MKKQVAVQEIRLDDETIQRLYNWLSYVQGLNRQPTPKPYQTKGSFGLTPDNPHPAERLDINDLLRIFDHLHLDPGYSLDYIYENSGLGGRPILYTRPADQMYPSTQLYDYQKKPEAGRPFLEHFYFDTKPLGYIQFAIFSVVSSQFYLFWHALYNDHQFVFKREEAQWLADHLENKSDDIDYKAELKPIDFSPCLDIEPDGTVRFYAFTFSKWSGFSYGTWEIHPSAFIQKINSKVMIPYNCGICY